MPDRRTVMVGRAVLLHCPGSTELWHGLVRFDFSAGTRLALSRIPSQRSLLAVVRRSVRVRGLRTCWTSCPGRLNVCMPGWLSGRSVDNLWQLADQLANPGTFQVSTACRGPGEVSLADTSYQPVVADDGKNARGATLHQVNRRSQVVTDVHCRSRGGCSSPRHRLLVLSFSDPRLAGRGSHGRGITWASVTRGQRFAAELAAVLDSAGASAGAPGGRVHGQHSSSMQSSTAVTPATDRAVAVARSWSRRVRTAPVSTTQPGQGWSTVSSAVSAIPLRASAAATSSVAAWPVPGAGRRTRSSMMPATPGT